MRPYKIGTGRYYKKQEEETFTTGKEIHNQCILIHNRKLNILLQEVKSQQEVNYTHRK